MRLLIGNTGLVGTTILESEHFNYIFNSKNIDMLKYKSSKV